MVAAESKPILLKQVRPADSDKSDAVTKKKKLSFLGLTANQKGAFVLLGFGHFAVSCCFSIIAPVFPFEAQAKHMQPAVMGIVFSCFELLIAIFAPVFGSFISRIGPKSLLINGQFLTGVCVILFGLLDKSPPGPTFSVLCLTVRSFKAVGASAVYTSAFVIMANEFPDHVTTVAGFLQTMYGTGWMVGPVIGGFLFEIGGYGLPFFTLGGLLLFSVVFTALLLSPPPVREKKPQRSMLRLLSNPLVAVTSASLVCGGYCFGFLDSSLSLHLDKFHLKASYVGLLFGMVATVYTVSAPLTGWIADRNGVRAAFMIIMVGKIFLGIAFLLIGPAPFLSFMGSELWLVIVSLVVIGLTLCGPIVCTVPCFYAGARRLGYDAGLDLDGLVAGLFSSCCNFGVFLGPTVGSAVIQFADFQWSTTVTSSLQFFSLLLMCLYLVAERMCLKYVEINKNTDIQMYDVIETCDDTSDASTSDDIS